MGLDLFRRRADCRSLWVFGNCVGGGRSRAAVVLCISDLVPGFFGERLDSPHALTEFTRSVCSTVIC